MDRNWKRMDISAVHVHVYFNTHSPGWITKVYLQPPHCSNDSNNWLNGVTVDNSFVLFTFFFWITSFMDNPMEGKKNKFSTQIKKISLYDCILLYLLHLFDNCAFPWFTSSWKINGNSLHFCSSLRTHAIFVSTLQIPNQYKELQLFQTHYKLFLTWRPKCF